MRNFLRESGWVHIGMGWHVFKVSYVGVSLGLYRGVVGYQVGGGAVVEVGVGDGRGGRGGPLGGLCFRVLLPLTTWDY